MNDDYGTGVAPKVARVRAVDLLSGAVPADASPALLRDVGPEGLAALVIEGLFAPEVVARVTEALESGSDHAWLIDDPDPAARLHMVGGLISPRRSAPRGPDLDEYLATSGPTRAACAALFGNEPDWFETLEAVLLKASGAAEVSVVTHPDGRTYVPTSIRGLEPGACFPPHCEAGYLRIAAYAPLHPRVHLDNKLGYFVLLAKPESGGELLLYDRVHSESVRHFEHRPHDADPSVPHTRVPMEAGDLVLLAAGQRYHQVTEIKGERSRWTMGGFAAYARERDAFHYWT